jgi:hypothetical protein
MSNDSTWKAKFMLAPTSLAQSNLDNSTNLNKWVNVTSAPVFVAPTLEPLVYIPREVIAPNILQQITSGLYKTPCGSPQPTKQLVELTDEWSLSSGTRSKTDVSINKPHQIENTFSKSAVSVETTKSWVSAAGLLDNH